MSRSENIAQGCRGFSPEGLVRVLRFPVAIAFLLAASCNASSPDSSSLPIRLVDQFKPEVVKGAPPATSKERPKIEWRFDGAAPVPAPPEFAATRGFEASRGIEGLALRDGQLAGRSTTDAPILRVTRTAQPDSQDQFHALEITMRVSAGTNLTARLAPPGPLPADIEALIRGPLGNMTTPIVAGTEKQTYTLTSPAPLNMSRARQLVIRPTDAAGATFDIESVRMITRREHLAGIPSGVGWQGLGEMYREALVSRSGETMTFAIKVPQRAWLDLALGTIDDQPATFRIAASGGGSADRVLLEHTVTMPYRWERRPVDLSEFAGRDIQLSLTLVAGEAGVPGLWGTPTVRTRSATNGDAPRGVILIQADTLRPDHLGLYGHKRDTAPFLAQLASEGAMFKHAYAQAGWTKVSSPSILTGLYPSTHGVATPNDRLPAAATTIAEVYRQAGYATLSLSSVLFSGQSTNLHQGFEELHEATSLQDQGGPYTSKSAREYVDRAAEWIEEHKDEPFFIYLHVFDPHSPYEPRRPYDALWADQSKRDEHIKQRETLRKVIADPFMRGRGMATRAEMVKGGIDPAAYIAYDRDWYDSSIRGLDAELARLFERLRAAGLDDNTAVVFLSDHGEEFHEHGRMWHGQSAYGEMVHVPLVIRWPGKVTAKTIIDQPVHLIDVMPTLLNFSRLPQPEGIQGQSLASLIQRSSGSPGTAAAANGFRQRPVVIEKQPLDPKGPFPNAAESYAIIDGKWKLIHNKTRPPEVPEFELFDVASDPFDQVNLADQHPDEVKRLGKALEGWRGMVTAARLKPDTEAIGKMTPEQLQRLRSLGYIK
jgi:arylsulfatase